MSFFAELKRRNVFKVAAAYIIVAWLLLQVSDTLVPALHLPEWFHSGVAFLLIIGFPIALIFAWAFEMTPDGIRKEKDVDHSQSITPKTDQKLNNIILVLMALAIGYLLFDKFSTPTQPVSEPISQQTSAQTTAIDEQGSPPSVEAATQSGDTDKSIAVLPFTNRSPNADDAYFTDGVHDDLLTQLAKINAFSVISRTSVMEYRDSSKNLKQIGEELGVANIMEGAVQRAGNRVRINVQLIDAGSDQHLWAEVYDRELTTENLFDIQSEIAKAIASALQTTLTDSEIAYVSEVPTGNVAAYELYLQGKRFGQGQTEIGFETSVELYEEALKLDPDFKLAWVGLSHTYITNYWNYGANQSDRDKARDAIDRAKAIDPDFPELYMAEGSYYYWGLLDYDTALTNLDKAIALMPSNAEAHMRKGWISRRAGLWEQAKESMQKSVKLNPRVAYNVMALAATLTFLGRYEEALKTAKAAYELAPDNYKIRTTLAIGELIINGDTERAATLVVGAQHTNDQVVMYPYWEVQMLTGQLDSALEIAREWSTDWEFDSKTINLRENLVARTMKALGRDTDAMDQARQALSRLTKTKQQGLDDHRVAAAELEAYGILGDTQMVSELVEKVLSSKPTDAIEDFNLKYRFAQSYANAGMSDESIATLELLLSGHSKISVPWLELDPAFNGIRNLPGFVALLEKYR